MKSYDAPAFVSQLQIIVQLFLNFQNCIHISHAFLGAGRAIIGSWITCNSLTYILIVMNRAQFGNGLYNSQLLFKYQLYQNLYAILFCKAVNGYQKGISRGKLRWFLTKHYAKCFFRTRLRRPAVLKIWSGFNDYLP